LGLSSESGSGADEAAIKRLGNGDQKAVTGPSRNRRIAPIRSLALRSLRDGHSFLGRAWKSNRLSGE
jgi:hypothetical protein